MGYEARFKFRMWNRSSKSYVDSDTYGLNLCGELFYFSPSEDGVHLSECEDYVIIEQCTGLKDKNGVLIYEGDICLREDEEKCVIVFYANGWCMDMSTYYPKAREGWCENILGTPKLEVIGNIYENGDLLT